MKRGKSQILYNYLPKRTFDFDNDEGIFIVKDFRHEPVIKGDINPRYVSKKIDSYISQWHDQMNGFEIVQGGNNYYFASVVAAEVSLFPLVFQCVNEKCKRIRAFSNVDKYKADPVCHKCSSSLRQLAFVAVHKCGEVKQLYVPGCPTHGYDSIVLDSRGSQRVANMVWICKEPGCSFEHRLYQTCYCEEKDIHSYYSYQTQ